MSGESSHIWTHLHAAGLHEYIKGGTPPICPVCNQRCIPVPYSVYEGVKCPCGQRSWTFDAPGEPWDGTFREYLAALQTDFNFMGMRLGSRALNRLTPEMFHSVVVRDFILTKMEAWYENSSWNGDLIACAANALGHIKAKEAVETLIKGLTCEEWYARMRIAEALGDIGDKRAVEPLKTLLAADKDERVRKAAADALKKLQSGG